MKKSSFRRKAKVALAIVILGGAAYLAVSGKAMQWRNAIMIARGDTKMHQRDFLAALGCYEKILGSDSTDATAHLRAAIALDSMHRPVEAGWHYKDAAFFQTHPRTN